MPYKNKDKKLQYHKNYNKQWYIDNIDNRKIYQDSILGRWYSHNYSAKRKHIINDLSFDQFEELTSKKCILCNEYTFNKNFCGIDRLDNNIGYIYKNCVPMCRAHNMSKGSFLIEDMRKIIQIYDERNNI